jgi:ABC-type glycerol-3-phosphate transport system substrate-binding protein
MRPFQIIVVGIFGFFAVVGLVVFSMFSGFDGKENVVGDVVIWGVLPQRAVDTVLQNLAQTEGERFKGVTYVEKQPARFAQETIEAIAVGSGPDLLILPHDLIVRLSGALYEIPAETYPPRSFRDLYADGADIFLTDTGTYGIPLAINPLIMYWNRPLLGSAGIAGVPQYWEQLNAFVPQMTRVDNAQNINQSAVALGEYANITNAHAILATILFQAGNTIAERRMGVVQSTLDARDGNRTSSAETALRFYTGFSNPVQSIYSWNRSLPASQQVFLRGDLALYFGMASEHAFIRASNPNLDFDVAQIPQPQTAAVKSTYGTVYALSVVKNSKNIEGAYTTAITLTLPEASKAIAEASGMAPARRTLLAEPQTDPYRSVVHTATLIARGWLSPDPAQANEVLKTLVETTISGRYRPAEAVANAHRALNELLQ